MINPIGFCPVSFGTRYTPYDAGKPKGLRPLEETDPATQIAKSSKLYQEIETIDKQIKKIEEKCRRADKTNPEFDKTAALQQIGKLINHRIVLKTQLEEDVAKALKDSNSQS